MPVVLRPKLSHPANFAERELEAMPIVGRGKGSHDEVDFTRSGGGAWRRDRGLGLLGFLGERLLDHRALDAVLLRGHETRPRRGWDRPVESRWCGWRLRRHERGWRRGFGLRRSSSDAAGQVDDLLVTLVFLLVLVLVVFGHFYPRRLSRYHAMTITMAASARAATMTAAERRRVPEASARSMAARISSAVASFLSQPFP